MPSRAVPSCPRSVGPAGTLPIRHGAVRGPAGGAADHVVNVRCGSSSPGDDAPGSSSLEWGGREGTVSDRT
jgi:hypothetical protein